MRINFIYEKDIYQFNVSKYALVKDIKNLIVENLDGIDNIACFDFIYNNFILINDYFINFYNISENETVWFGKIEDYLSQEDIILEIFLIGYTPEMIFLIVRKDYCISNIMSILRKVMPMNNTINVWNINGVSLTNDEKIYDLDARGYYKIIISWCDNFNYTFNNCAEIHDLCLVEKFGWAYDSNLWSLIGTFDWIDELNDKVERLKQNFILLVSSNSKLNENISLMPKSFKNSRLLFCINIVKRIMSECEDHFMEVNKEDRDMNILKLLKYFRAKLALVILEDLCSVNESYDIFDKCFSFYVYQTLEYVFCLNKKTFLDYFLLGSRDLFESENIIFNFYRLYKYVNIRFQASTLTWVTIQKNLETVSQIRDAISWQTGLSSNEFLLIKSGDGKIPNDNDLLEEGWDYLIEIICGTDNIIPLKKIGEGGYGKVHLYKNLLTNSEFVMKMCKKSDLYVDISIHSRIPKNSVLEQYMGVYTNGKKLGLALTYFEGGSLRSYLEIKGQIDEKEISKISYQLLEQIIELHNKKIIHRDIKCDNVVFDEQHSAKLIDFGLSKSYSKSTLSMINNNYSQGNLGYAAPEILFMEEYSEKVDIWSFGILVIFMITGKDPFPNSFSIQMAKKIREAGKLEINFQNSVSKDLKDFVNSCLKSYPEDRPTAKELIQSNFIIGNK